MEKHNPEAMLQEIRNLTARLNNLSEYVKTINEQFHGAYASEQKFYTFLGVLVDKLIRYQETKSSKQS